MVSPDTYILESANILSGTTDNRNLMNEVKVILEDTTSPITVRHTEQLFDSIRQKLLVLPDDTLVLCGHGPATTIGDEKLQFGLQS